MSLVVLLAAIPAFALSWAGTWFARSWAVRLGLLDHPGTRKVHQRSIPLGGGVAMWLAVVLTLAGVHLVAWFFSGLAQWPRWLPAEAQVHLPGLLSQAGRMWLALAAGTILMLLGLLDDCRPLGWRLRLAVQFLAATALVLAGFRLSLFIEAPWLTGLVSVGWIVVLINAFNFLDNMDGLTAGVVVVSGTLMAVVMLQAGQEPHLFVAGFVMVVVGSAAGFLCHNWPPARIFMGDAGSYFLGLMMAIATVAGTFHEPSLPRHAVVAPLCVLAIPLYDFVSVLCIRLTQGRSPFHPDKSHFSHRLVELNLSPRAAVLTIYLATLATGLGALLLYQVRHWSGAAVVFAIVLCVLLVIAILETAPRRRKPVG